MPVLKDYRENLLTYDSLSPTAVADAQKAFAFVVGKPIGYLFVLVEPNGVRAYKMAYATSQDRAGVGCRDIHSLVVNSPTLPNTFGFVTDDFIDVYHENP
jgi:hypothetical protein